MLAGMSLALFGIISTPVLTKEIKENIEIQYPFVTLGYMMQRIPSGFTLTEGVT